MYFVDITHQQKKHLFYFLQLEIMETQKKCQKTQNIYFVIFVIIIAIKFHIIHN